jgi:uncharacterized protein (DUF488 family)
MTVFVAIWVQPMKPDDIQLLTLGHGTLGQTELCELLRTMGVEALVDVRTAPGSRRYPHVARAEMERWLPAAGVAYQWEPRLGGWRKAAPASPNTALRNESFRGYADYMRSAQFWDALDGVLDLAGKRRTAVMCSESVYWRCHRRLIADAAFMVRGTDVLHIGHNASLSLHQPTEGARPAEGRLVYDVGTSTPLIDVPPQGPFEQLEMKDERA